MARARNIKPGFFSNEVLVDLPAFDRLLFMGLWCLADREGRLEDRVRRIKMELFPCDNYDVDVGLNNLNAAGFISRYVVEGHAVIEVVNFLRHQSPHGTEKDSELPDIDGYVTVYARKNKVVIAGSQRKIHVSSLKNNVTEPLEPVNAPLRNALIPDSGFTDSLIQEDQHHSLPASEDDPQVCSGRKPARAKLAPVPAQAQEEHLSNSLQEQQSSPVPEPPPALVDPKTPAQMTLDWMPDDDLLKTYCVHFGVSTDLFTREAVAPFTAHHETAGTLNIQSKWVSLLVRWVKGDKTRASNVRDFPARRQSTEPDFDDTSWAEKLMVKA